MVKKIFLIVSFLAILLLPLGARAAQIRTETDTNGVINSSETPKNLYLFGNNLLIQPDIKGDLTVAGSSILINSNIEQDLFAAGQTVTVRGNVGNSIRAAGNVIDIIGNVQGDVLVAGSSVNINQQSTISGDLFVAGGNVTIDGTVLGQTKIAGGTVTVNGQVHNLNITSQGGTVKFGSQAVVDGQLHYTATSKATFDSGSKVTGLVTFTQDRSQMFNGLIRPWTILLEILMGVVLLLLLWKLMPKTTDKIVSLAFDEFPRRLLTGLAVTFVAPLLILLLFVTILGIPLALVLTALYVALAIICTFIGKLLVGIFLIRSLTKDKKASADLITIVVGVAAILVIGFIPIFGGLAGFIVFLWSVGTVSQLVLGFRDRKIASVISAN